MHSNWSLIRRAFNWCTWSYLAFNWSSSVWNVFRTNEIPNDALTYCSSRWIRFSFSVCSTKYIRACCIAHVNGVPNVWLSRRHVIWQVLFIQEDAFGCVLNEDPLRLYTIAAFRTICLCCFLNVISCGILLRFLLGQVPALVNDGAGAARTEGVIGVILVSLQVWWAILLICLQDGLTTLLLIMHWIKDLVSMATTWRNSSERANIETTWLMVLYSGGFCSMMRNVSFLLLRCKHLDLHLLLNWKVRPHEIVKCIFLLEIAITVEMPTTIQSLFWSFARV